ncbi:hypothetical protein LTR22_024480 [Elasticomyces elasticus]|nr:hypothetical protein LTR22_024480 [Elasticomyces elasticus]
MATQRKAVRARSKALGETAEPRKSGDFFNINGTLSLLQLTRVLQSCGDQEQRVETEEDTETNDGSDDSDDGGSGDDSVDDEGYSSEPVIDVFQYARGFYPWHRGQKELLGVFQQSMEQG